MLGRYLPNHKYVVEPIQELVVRQLPWGEIWDVPSQRRMHKKTNYAAAHQGIRWLNVTETQLAAELFSEFTEGQLHSCVFKCVEWLDTFRNYQSLFPLWVPGPYILPERNINIRKVEQIANIRCTAQRDSSKLLIGQYDDAFKDSLKKLLDFQFKNWSWAESSTNVNQGSIFATANAIMLIYKVDKECSRNSEFREFIQLKFKDFDNIRRSWRNGLGWFYSKADLNWKLSNEPFPLFTTSSAYMILYPLLSHHDKELPIEKRTLDNFVDYLLKNHRYGVWSDSKKHRNFQNLSTTIRVLALVTQFLKSDSVKDSSVLKGLDYVMKNLNMENLTSSDLIYWIRTLINVHGKDKILEAITPFKTTWPFSTNYLLESSDLEKLKRYYQEWLIQSKKRSQALKIGVDNHVDGYSQILSEEIKYAKEIITNLENPSSTKFYPISKNKKEENGQQSNHKIRRFELALLFEILNVRFSADEIRVLTLFLDIDFENLEGETKIAKIVSLLNYCEQRNSLPELIKTIKRMRSDIDT